MKAKKKLLPSIYVGPHCMNRLQRNTIFREGKVLESVQLLVKSCPAIGELIVPMDRYAEVRRQLAFDYAGNMRGTQGKYVTFYQNVQAWLVSRAKPNKEEPSTGVQIHA